MVLVTAFRTFLALTATADHVDVPVEVEQRGLAFGGGHWPSVAGLVLTNLVQVRVDLAGSSPTVNRKDLARFGQHNPRLLPKLPLITQLPLHIVLLAHRQRLTYIHQTVISHLVRSG